MIFKSAKILTERKYDASESSSETSSDSDALDFDLEVEESWRARLTNFITEIHAYVDELLADEEWLKITKAKQEIRERPSRKTRRHNTNGFIVSCAIIKPLLFFGEL